MDLSLWIPKIKIIPLQNTKPCGFASGGFQSVLDFYDSNENSFIIEKIKNTNKNGFGYLPNGPVFLLTKEEWDFYKISAPSYMTKEGVFVIFSSGTVRREWKPWIYTGWYVPYEGEGIFQLKKGKAYEIPEKFLPCREDFLGETKFLQFDHDVDWVVRKTFEAGKRNDKREYAHILSVVGSEWDCLMDEAWKVGVSLSGE